MVGIKDLLEGWRSNNGGERVSFGFVLFRAECLSEEDDHCGPGLKDVNTSEPNGQLRAALSLLTGRHCRPSQNR